MKKLQYAYYPGCTQDTTAREYDESVRELCAALGIDLADLPGWICCGASSGHATDYWFSHALSGKNLAIAERLNLDIAVACPACYQRLRATLREFKVEEKLRHRLPSLLGQPFKAKRDVRHVLDIITNTVGLDLLCSKVVRPLANLKAVAYYGCYVVRPPELTGFDDAENPRSMDNLLKVLGVDVRDWRGKVLCCGGSQSFTLRNSVIDLVSDIKAAACEVDADAIITACPLCQVNLETRQSGKSKLPVFYFSELAALALGIENKRWWSKHLIDPQPLLKKYDLLKRLAISK